MLARNEPYHEIYEAFLLCLSYLVKNSIQKILNGYGDSFSKGLATTRLEPASPRQDLNMHCQLTSHKFPLFP